MESLRKRKTDITKEIRTVKKTIYTDPVNDLKDAQKREEDELRQSLTMKKAIAEEQARIFAEANNGRLGIEKKEFLRYDCGILGETRYDGSIRNYP